MNLTTNISSHRHWQRWLTLSLLLLLAACTPMAAPAANPAEPTAVATTAAAQSAITETAAITDTSTPTTSQTMTETESLTGTTNLTDAAGTADSALTNLSATEQELVEAAMALVEAESGVDATTLTLVSLAAVEWSDGSLGCPQPGMMYSQVIIPGYQITLQDANGSSYEVHSGSEPGGEMIFCQAEAKAEAEASAATLSGVFTGTVTYLQRIALPPGSVINVELQDVSRADAVAEIIASQTITTSGENVPIPFELTYDPSQIEQRFTYAIRVQIMVDGALRWTNTERYAVLTNGNPTSGIEVVVMPVQ